MAFIPGLIVVACIVGIVMALIINTDKKLKAEYLLKSDKKQKVNAK